MYRLGVLCLMIAVFSLGLPAVAQDGDPPVRYDNYKVVRVDVPAVEQFDALHALGARLMSEAEGVGPVDYLVPPEGMSGLAALGLHCDVLIDDIQVLIDAERARLSHQAGGGPRDPAWFTDYKTYDQVNAKLNQMATDRPDLASVLDIGTTLQNRHIYGIRITGPGTNKPAIFFDGCHHAREWISVMVPMWIADKLVYNYNTDPTIRALVDRVEFFIIPVVNVDGYVYTWTTDRMWRKNRRLNAGGCYGVDDNRNYSAGWGGEGSSGDPCSEIYRGTAAFSEPETVAMRDFAIAHPQILSSQSYHSYSQLVMSPYGYTANLPADNSIFMTLDAGQHDQILAVHGMQYGYGPIYSTIYPASGNTVDWFYDHEGVFSFTTELRDTGQYGFILPPAQIIPTCEENFAAAAYLAQWTSTPIKFDFPGGLPSRLQPDTPTTVVVKITVIGATLDPASPKLFTRVGDTGQFIEQALTSIGGGKYQGTLPATSCGRTLKYYFQAQTTTGVTGTSPTDAPNTLYQATATPIQLILDQNLDINPGWTTQSLWAWGTPTGGGGDHGGPDPTAGHTGTKVYGYNLSGGYTNNMSEQNLTTTAINCSGTSQVFLSFWRWLGVEQNAYDHAYVRVSNNGSTYTTIWQNPSTTLDDQAWVYQEFDISAYAANKPAVNIRWTMGTSDGGWTYCGWNVDDVQVWTPGNCPGVRGDFNCDGVVDFADIDPFVTVLSGGACCDPTGYNCDVNGDGAVNFADIDPFVALLGG